MHGPADATNGSSSPAFVAWHGVVAVPPVPRQVLLSGEGLGEEDEEPASLAEVPGHVGPRVRGCVFYSWTTAPPASCVLQPTAERLNSAWVWRWLLQLLFSWPSCCSRVWVHTYVYMLWGQMRFSRLSAITDNAVQSATGESRGRATCSCSLCLATYSHEQGPGQTNGRRPWRTCCSSPDPPAAL